LLITFHRRQLAIDLVGFPGDVGAGVHVHRYQMLHRAGIPLIPLSAQEWLTSPELILQQIQTWLPRANRIAGRKTVSLNVDTQTIIDEESWQKLEHFKSLFVNQTLELLQVVAVEEYLQKIARLLSHKFEPQSLTFKRYQGSIDKVVSAWLENLGTYQLLYQQMRHHAQVSDDQWQTLIKPVVEKNELLVQGLEEILAKLQHNLANQQLDAASLEDLNRLTEQLDKY